MGSLLSSLFYIHLADGPIPLLQLLDPLLLAGDRHQLRGDLFLQMNYTVDKPGYQEKGIFYDFYENYTIPRLFENIFVGTTQID